jgi:hypothetical protein
MMAAAPVFVLGLVVTEVITLPLALGCGALFGALSAGWAGTFWALDGTRSRLFAIVGMAEAAAMLMTMLLLLALTTPLDALLSRGVVKLGLPMLVIVGTIVVSTWSLRTHTSYLGQDLLTTVGLIGLAVLAIPFSLVFANKLSCRTEEREALGELDPYPYTSVAQASDPKADMGGCFVSFTTADPAEQVLRHYREQLSAHGWTVEPPTPVATTDGQGQRLTPRRELRARRGPLSFEASYEGARLRTEGTLVTLRVGT